MGLFVAKFVFVAIVGFLGRLQSTSGIRFVLDREDCFSHSVLYEGDKVHVSFVVIKADSRWQNNEDGLDLVVSFTFSSANLTWCLLSNCFFVELDLVISFASDSAN